MKRIINKAPIVFIIIILAFCIAGLSGCDGEHYAKTVSSPSGFNGSISLLLPEHAVAKNAIGALMERLRRGSAIEAYDLQDLGGIAEYWYPLTLETVVIAVDRSRTDMRIESWSDLRGSDAAIGIICTMPHGRMVAAAISHGLEGEDFTFAAAVDLLAPLAQAGKLGQNDMTAPIQICFDSVAAARIKDGENIEIIVPSEGTLTYARGLLSKTPLALPDNADQILIDHALRLPDARCDDTIYPASSQYANALFPDSKLRAYIADVTQNWTRVMRREIFNMAIYSSADGFEQIIFPAAFVIIAIIWFATMSRRSRQKSVRGVIFYIGTLLFGWLLARILKYEIHEPDELVRYLWYSYYIFQCLLPLGLLRIGTLIGTTDQLTVDSAQPSVLRGTRHASASRFLAKSGVPRWLIAVSALNVALAALVMTNDLHGMMFELDMSLVTWTRDYSYGLLYYVVAVTLLLQINCGIILIFAKIKHSPRRAGFIFPIILVVILTITVIGSVLKLPLFKDIDTVTLSCAFSLLFLETCFQTGQIPINVRYRRLFKSAGLKLQITDNGGIGVLMSDDAEPMSSEQWSAIGNRSVMHADENTLLRKNSISGGFAVWREDVSHINKLKADIESSNREIEAANALLAAEAQSKEQAARTSSRLELYMTFENDIAGHERRLAALLESDPEDGSERAENMKKAAILTCYIKRRSYFLSVMIEKNMAVSYNEFVVYIDELAELARLSGIQCLTFCSLMGELSLQKAMLLYDFWASLLEWAIANREGEIVLQTMSEDGRLTMRLTMGTGAISYELPAKISQDISAAGGSFDKTADTEIGFTALRVFF